MKRWHEDYPIAYREWKKHHRFHVEQNTEIIVRSSEDLYHDPWKIDCPCDTQVGRFRKRDAWDCGNPRCYVCHSDKFPKRDVTYQEWSANLKLREGVRQFEEEKDD